MAEQVFKPTALLVMEHNITGLKYFCKTSLLDRVHRYKGSGIAWLKHLREHGFNVKVGLLGFYVEEKRCLDAAKKFSVDNDIVESKEWANIVEETGKIGASMKGEKNPFYGKKHKPESVEAGRLKRLGRSVNKGAFRSPEHRAKISAALKGKSNPIVNAKLKGRKLTEEHKINIGKGRKGYTHSMETREKLRLKALEQWSKVKLAEEQQ